MSPRRILIILLFTICTFAAASAKAATNRETALLTLEQTLTIAAQQNRSIARAEEFRNQAAGIFISERSAALPHLTVNGMLQREDDDAPDSPAIDRREAWLQLDQALFAWGQLQAGIRAARIGLQTAGERLRASRQDALRDAALAFYDILFARELNNVQVRILEQKRRRLDEARKRQSVGLATDYDVLVAEVAEVNARPEVVRSDNLVRTLRDRLRLVLGLGEPVDVCGTLEAALADPPNYQEAMAIARERRPELRDLRHRIAIAEELVTIANAGDKPRIDLTGSFGWKAIDDHVSDVDGAYWDFALKLSWPVFDGLQARGKVQAARSERDALRIDELQLVDKIALETREALDRVRVATELLRALQGSVAQAERLLQLAEKGYEYGVKIRLEVDDAELNLRQARTSLALARRDYLVAMVELARAMGILGEATFPGLPVPPLILPLT